MKNKILILFIVLLFSVGIAWAENNTTENLDIEDSGNYILPISIANNVIKFDDGFEGFCLDLSKESIATSDKFELSEFSNSDIENKVKLAIIECYKQSKESDIGKIVPMVFDDTSNNEVIKEVVNSNEKIGNEAVVNIDNATEATFTFELLKSTDDSKSDVLAYKVSTKTVEQPEIISASADNDDDKKTDEPDNDKTTQEDTNDKKTDDQTSENTANNNSDESATNNNSDEKTSDNKKTSGNTEPKNNTKVNEKNETIVNKTNTVIVNENNTTIINNNNVKTINNTNDTPGNNTTSKLLKAAGNPIFILIIVIVIIAIVAVAMRRKD